MKDSRLPQGISDPVTFECTCGAGKEGFNVTVGGTASSIEAYIKACLSHWSFEGLDLGSEEKQKQFFKPTPGGCACVFGGPPASVLVKNEITPMGVTNYVPKKWDAIE